MKAIIAAGGRGTRMRPITHTMNKHLIPLANRPMLEYPIQKLKEAGIVDIAINVNPGEMDLMQSFFGDGSRFGVNLTYIEQQGGAMGIAHAVANAEPFLHGSKFVFFLGDNIMVGSLRKMRERFDSENINCMIALARVKDPQRFGVPEFDDQNNLIATIEKPTNPPSPFAITGIYFFDEQYFDAFKTITPSARGEYEITDMINWYLKNGKVGYHEITGWWKDTGTADALLQGNALLLDEMLRGQEYIPCKLHDQTQIHGNVYIGQDTKIGANVLIRGPVVIGKNCELDNCYIGPYTSIGDGTKINNTELEYSIVMSDANIQAKRRIINAIIGSHVVITSSDDSLPISGHRLVIGDNSVVEL